MMDVDGYMLKAVGSLQTGQGRLTDRLYESAREMFIRDEMKKISFYLREIKESGSGLDDDEGE